MKSGSCVKTQIGPPWWDDKPVYLIGGGPSLRGFNFARLRDIDAHIVGINQSIFDVPCHAGVTVDATFIERRRVDLEAIALTVDLIVGTMLHPIKNATCISCHFGGGLSLNLGRVFSGGTSGYAALNVAVLKRARRIVLLGFDYGAANGRHHYHDAYPWFEPHKGYPTWAMAYDTTLDILAARGISVVNASPDSAITAFPKVSLDAPFDSIAGHAGAW